MPLLHQSPPVRRIPRSPRPSSSLGSSPAGSSLALSPATCGPGAASLDVLALGVVLLPVALWKRPYIAPAVLLGAAVLVEQGPAVPSIPITSSIPMFTGLGPIACKGADMLLLTVLFIYLAKGKDWGTRVIPRTHVSLAVLAVLGCAGLAIAVGQSHDGSLQTGLMQVRPWVYLAATYFLTSAFVRDRRTIRALLWTFVGTVGFKAVQGIYVWISNRDMVPKPESFISHEASYFFVIFVILVAALWLFGQSGKLRTWATRLLPVVISCDPREQSPDSLGDAGRRTAVLRHNRLQSAADPQGRARKGHRCPRAVFASSTSPSCGTATVAWARRRGRSSLK